MSTYWQCALNDGFLCYLGLSCFFLCIAWIRWLFFWQQHLPQPCPSCCLVAWYIISSPIEFGGKCFSPLRSRCQIWVLFTEVFFCKTLIVFSATIKLQLFRKTLLSCSFIFHLSCLHSFVSNLWKLLALELGLFGWKLCQNGSIVHVILNSIILDLLILYLDFLIWAHFDEKFCSVSALFSRWLDSIDSCSSQLHKVDIFLFHKHLYVPQQLFFSWISTVSVLVFSSVS